MELSIHVPVEELSIHVPVDLNMDWKLSTLELSIHVPVDLNMLFGDCVRESLISVESGMIDMFKYFGIGMLIG